jgi:hypothetical protein
MRRLLRAAWLLLLAGSACETAGKAERVEKRQQELFELNQGLASDSQLTPRTARERDDPLLIDPQTWPEPERPRRP